MKKVVFGIAAVLLCFISLLVWHDREQTAWREWKLQGFYIIDKAEEKRAMGWSKDSISAFGDSLELAVGRKTPSKCPYCFVRSLIE